MTLTLESHRQEAVMEMMDTEALEADLRRKAARRQDLAGEVEAARAAVAMERGAVVAGTAGATARLSAAAASCAAVESALEELDFQIVGVRGALDQARRQQEREQQLAELTALAEQAAVEREIAERVYLDACRELQRQAAAVIAARKKLAGTRQRFTALCHRIDPSTQELRRTVAPAELRGVNTLAALATWDNWPNAAAAGVASQVPWALEKAVECVAVAREKAAGRAAGVDFQEMRGSLDER